MSEPRNHHFVPQFLLRRFRDDSGKLWVYDTELNRVYASGTKRAGAVEDLYAVKTGDGSMDYASLENAFDKDFENPGAPAIEKILNREFLDDGAALSFVAFVAAQLCRTPSFIARIADVVAPAMQEMCRRILKFEPGFRDGLAAKLSESGASTRLIDELFAGVERGEVGPAQQYALLLALNQIDKVVELLTQMNWCFLDVPEGDLDLVIGDHPVTLFDAGPKEETPRGLGLSNPHVEVAMPLSKRVAALARWHGPVYYGTMRVGEVNSLNFTTLSHVQRYVYASVKSDDLLALAMKKKGTGPKVRVRRMEADGKLLIIKEYY